MSTAVLGLLLLAFLAPASALATPSPGDCTKAGPASVGAGCETPKPSQGGATGSSPAATAAAPGKFRSLMNYERRNRRIGGLDLSGQLAAIARDHAARMARSGRIYHNDSLFAAETISSLGDPDYVGENVGRGSSVEAIHDAFMRSTDHRENIIDRRYVFTGVGVVSSNGELWVVETFMSRPHRGQVLPGGYVSRPFRARLHYEVAQPATKAAQVRAYRWVRAPIPRNGTATLADITAVPRTLKRVPRSIGAIVVVMALTMVLGVAIPRRDADEDFV